MPQNLDALTAEVTRFETLEAGVEAVFSAQAVLTADAVKAAIVKTMADDGATAAQVQAAAQTAIDGVVAQFKADNDKLTSALAANTGIPATTDPPATGSI